MLIDIQYFCQKVEINIAKAILSSCQVGGVLGRTYGTEIVLDTWR